MNKIYLYNVYLIDGSCFTVESLLALTDLLYDINNCHDYDYYRIGDCIFRKGQIKTIRFIDSMEDDDES